MEHLEVVDAKDNRLTGIVLPRHEVLSNQFWCRSTNVFVFNSEGALLCHQRSMQKERKPGAWSTHLGGHVGAGESYELNAVKELEEEAGINVDPKSLIPWRTTKVEAARLWVREYVTIIDEHASAFTPQPGEVDQFAWKHLHEIVQEFRKQPQAWYAGTHDLVTEYQCMRAVLTAAGSLGVLTTAVSLCTWHPPQLLTG